MDAASLMDSGMAFQVTGESTLTSFEIYMRDS